MASIKSENKQKPADQQKRITFVLPPGFNFSGGVRVTVEMANRLLAKGFAVRLVYRRTPLLSLTNFKQILKLFIIVIRLVFIEQKHNWLKDFKGEIEAYSNLNNLSFAEGEFVIAVGLMTVHDVSQLTKNVNKIRYCHGLQEQDPELMQQAWSPTMDTIAVSRQLIPSIQRLTQSSNVIEVIPNGIDLSHYYIENHVRNGIGTIFNRNRIKNPDFIVSLLTSVREKIPDARQYMFGIDKQPQEFYGHYYRYPSIAKAREWYNRCKIWIIASRSEGFSLPILEAMACGCAVISTAHQGSRELIRHGYNGFIVPVDDLAEFIKYIGLLWTNKDLRQEIVNHGLLTVKKYNWERSVNKMVDYLLNYNKASGRNEN
jgi:glycosyltransferase involved in cell wall biosynthesis